MTAVENVGKTDEPLQTYLNQAVEHFSDKYEGSGHLPRAIKMHPTSGIASFRALCEGVKLAGQQIYLIVDNADAAKRQFWHCPEVSSAVQSAIGAFHRVVHMGTMSVVGRAFYTHEGRTRRCRRGSGTLRTTAVSLDMLGFTQQEVKVALSRLALTENEQQQHLKRLTKICKGETADWGKGNVSWGDCLRCTTVLHYLDDLQVKLQGRSPELSSNLLGVQGPCATL